VALRGGCGVVGSCVHKTRSGEGFGSKQTETELQVARFWAAMGLQEVERGAVGLQPPSMLTREWDCE